VPKTLLAVDDSATMRKVLEITFVGEDFNVLSSGDRNGALGKLGENPSAVVIDTTLEGDDGYALCKEVRQRLPRAAIVLMSSRYSPYDQGRGKDAGADDYIDKPFDTQQLIDKVKKAIGVREAAAPAAAAAPPAHAPPPHAPPPAPPTPQPAPQRIGAVASPPSPPVAPKPPYQPPAAAAPARSGTLMFSVDGPPGPAAPAAAPEPPRHAPPAPVAARPPVPAHAPAAPAPTPAPTAAPIAAAAASANGALAPKLAALGLTPAQVEGVLALSREVVEQVVWEVVPQLAETLIKEEIARLTKE